MCGDVLYRFYVPILLIFVLPDSYHTRDIKSSSISYKQHSKKYDFAIISMWYQSDTRHQSVIGFSCHYVKALTGIFELTGLVNVMVQIVSQNRPAGSHRGARSNAQVVMALRWHVVATVLYFLVRCFLVYFAGRRDRESRRKCRAEIYLPAAAQ